VPRPRRLVILLAALLAIAGLSACGKHQNESARVKHADTEGIYLDISKLKYQVQVSRLMNPYDIQDKPVLEGVPAAQRQLAADEVWFGVWLRVQNETSRPEQPSADIRIVDTQENVFRPIAFAPSNPFAYRSSQIVPPDEVVPLPDSPAYNAPERGALLLFKLKNVNLDNRPLELHIVGRGAPVQEGIVDLDL
jgi:hypothetical protein